MGRHGLARRKKLRQRTSRKSTALTTRQTVAKKPRRVAIKHHWSRQYVVRVVSRDAARESWAAYLRRMTNRPNWSVAKLARETGLNPSAIFRYLNGTRRPTVANARLIGKALGDLDGALRAAATVADEHPAETDDATSEPAEPSPAAPEIAEIMGFDIPDWAKLELIRAVMERQARKAAG